jgi:hypothetical protein
MKGFRLSVVGVRLKTRGVIVAMLGLMFLTASACGDKTTTTPTTTTTSPTTSVFSSRLTPGGAVSRQFGASTAGTVTAMLTNAAGPNTVVGLGIGVPTTGLAKCALTTTIQTNAGPTPQLSASVDAGNYCVVVFDLGTLTSAIDFSVTLVYP